MALPVKKVPDPWYKICPFLIAMVLWGVLKEEHRTRHSNSSYARYSRQKLVYGHFSWTWNKAGYRYWNEKETSLGAETLKRLRLKANPPTGRLFDRQCTLYKQPTLSNWHINMTRQCLSHVACYKKAFCASYLYGMQSVLAERRLMLGEWDTWMSQTNKLHKGRCFIFCAFGYFTYFK